MLKVAVGKMEEKQQVGNITFAPGFTNIDYPHGLAGCSVDEQVKSHYFCKNRLA
jgi:hypothetical protein